MIEQACRGDIELAYVDESGFAQAHPNRSAWTPLGQQHGIDAKRGKRLNVMGALLSCGQLLTATYWETTTAYSFAGFLGLLKEKVDKPLTVILDNASVHTAKLLQPYVDFLHQKGLTLYFIPPYSPELNRIEKLWYTIKHKWLAFKTRDSKTLQADLNEIIQNFGSKYRFSFY